MRHDLLFPLHGTSYFVLVAIVGLLCTYAVVEHIVRVK